VTAAALVSCAAAGWVCGHCRALPWAWSWMLHAWARMQDAQWFIKRLTCGGCGHRTHVMRAVPGAAIAGLGDGRLCRRCSGRPA
jgi:hypothetical protein